MDGWTDGRLSFQQFSYPNSVIPKFQHVHVGNVTDILDLLNLVVNKVDVLDFRLIFEIFNLSQAVVRKVEAPGKMKIC
jgi:hypothetical protein